MKILLFPNEIRGNPYFQTFRAGLRAAGLQDVRLSSVLRLRARFDVMHLHFPEHVVTQSSWPKSIILSTALLGVALYARMTGRPVVWMVHDVEPAWVRRKALLTAFMKAINALTTAHIFLNKSSQQLFYRNNPQEAHKPFCLTPHSRFETPAFDADKVRAHREAHGVGETDILVSFLGSITHYKGLECAALVPDKTKTGQDVKIAVCGMIDHVLPCNYIDNMLRHKTAGTYIRVAERLTDDELALWIRSSEAVLLPYRSGSNSGMALNVLSNHGRIIASDLPMFKELAQGCGPSWIRCVDARSAAAVSDMIDALPAWTRQAPDYPRLETILAEGDPVVNGRKLRDFYRRLRGRELAAPVA